MIKWQLQKFREVAFYFHIFLFGSKSPALFQVLQNKLALQFLSLSFPLKMLGTVGRVGEQREKASITVAHFSHSENYSCDLSLPNVGNAKLVHTVLELSQSMKSMILWLFTQKRKYSKGACSILNTVATTNLQKWNITCKTAQWTNIIQSPTEFLLPHNCKFERCSKWMLS